MLNSKMAVDLYEKQNVLTERELKARVEIELEKYKMQIQIESRLCGDIAMSHILPVVFRYQNMLIENVHGIYEIMPKAAAAEASNVQFGIVQEISERVGI